MDATLYQYDCLKQHLLLTTLWVVLGQKYKRLHGQSNCVNKVSKIK